MYSVLQTTIGQNNVVQIVLNGEIFYQNLDQLNSLRQEEIIRYSLSTQFNQTVTSTTLIFDDKDGSITASNFGMTYTTVIIVVLSVSVYVLL